MTVGELIERLRCFLPSAPVLVDGEAVCMGFWVDAQAVASVEVLRTKRGYADPDDYTPDDPRPRVQAVVISAVDPKFLGPS